MWANRRFQILLFEVSKWGGFAPATASDGRRVGRPNVRFFASGQGRPVAIRDKNKRSDWDEWLAVSLA